MNLSTPITTSSRDINYKEDTMKICNDDSCMDVIPPEISIDNGSMQWRELTSVPVYIEIGPHLDSMLSLWPVLCILCVIVIVVVSAIKKYNIAKLQAETVQEEMRYDTMEYMASAGYEQIPSPEHNGWYWQKHDQLTSSNIEKGE